MIGGVPGPWRWGRNIERMLVEADVSGKDFAGRGGRAFEVETSTAEAQAAQCCLRQDYRKADRLEQNWEESTRMRQCFPASVTAASPPWCRKPEVNSLKESRHWAGMGVRRQVLRMRVVAPLGQRRGESGMLSLN